jgi:hypothetical protein
MSKFKKGDKVKFKDIETMFKLCNGDDTTDIKTFACFVNELSNKIVTATYTVESNIIPDRIYTEVKLKENSWIVPIKYLEKIGPPNLREATTCTKCKYYDFTPIMGAGDYEKCEKYGVGINEYLICDDFEEENK